MANKVRTMITLDPDTFKDAKNKCILSGQKLSSVIEIYLRKFIKEKA